MGSGEVFGDDCENIGLGCALEAFRFSKLEVFFLTEVMGKPVFWIQLC
jgi:hypothetical protein